MKIVVMCGGLSPERNVSITSSALICRALRNLGHKAVLVDMFFGIEDFDGNAERYFDELPPIPEASVGGEVPDLDKYILPPCRIKSSVLLLSILIVIMGWRKPVSAFWNKNIPNPSSWWQDSITRIIFVSTHVARICLGEI